MGLFIIHFFSEMSSLCLGSKHLFMLGGQRQYLELQILHFKIKCIPKHWEKVTLSFLTELISNWLLIRQSGYEVIPAALVICIIGTQSTKRPLKSLTFVLKAV